MIISLLSLAFSVVYMPTKVFYLALGGVFSIVPYVVNICLQHNFPWYLSVVAGVIFSVLLSVVIELVNHNRLNKKKASVEAHLIASLGMYIVITQFIIFIWGNGWRVLRYKVGLSYNFNGVIVTEIQVLSLVVSMIVILLYLFLLKNTGLGIILKALSDNEIQLSLLGYNVHIYRLIAFALSGLLCSICSILMAYDIGYEPNIGIIILLNAIVSFMVGGRNIIFGPIIGSIVFGIISSWVEWNLGGRWDEVFTLFLMVILLFIRPKGIMGQYQKA